MGGGDNGVESGITGEIEMVMGEEGMPGKGRRTASLCGIVIRGVIVRTLFLGLSINYWCYKY